MISNKSSETKSALEGFFSALSRLREEGILINSKDITCQLGEWLIEQIFDGRRSTNGVEKGWDVLANGRYIQVKTHAKAESNGARFSRIRFDRSVKVDELIIIVFANGYKLERVFIVPWREAEKLVSFNGGEPGSKKLSWSKISQYEQDLHLLPKQDIVNLLR